MSRRIQHLRRTLLPCTALAAFAALTLSAAAQVTSAQQSAIRSNCRSDFMSHCSGVTPGGKDALACLQKNVAKLSGGCQTAVRATIPAEPKVAAPAAAPPPPPPAAAAEPAPAAKPATIVSAPPPKAHTAKKPMKKPATAAVVPAAPAPQAAETAAPTAAQQSAMRSNCRNDFMSKCSGVTPGGKDALACLQSNVASLSPGCKRVVSATMKGGAPAAAAAAAPAAAGPEPASAENGFVPGGMLISKACARTILMQCRGMTFDMPRKVACLADYAKSGHFVGPRCETALKVSGHLR
jgi:hypothetical protein